MRLIEENAGSFAALIHRLRKSGKTQPTPQVRLFGRFVEADTLILTKFHTRNFLGPKGSRNWNEAMQQCEQTWRQLFGNDNLLIGNMIGDYVTEHCDVFDI